MSSPQEVPPPLYHEHSPPPSFPKQTIPGQTRAGVDEAFVGLEENDVDLPPAYASVDTRASVFRADPPLLYSCDFSHTPRYQLHLNLTQSGKPYQLRIRRLRPSETRRLSLISAVSSASSSGSRSRCGIDYEDDCTLYEIKNVAAFGGTGIEIRGCRLSALPGYIKLEKCTGLTGRYWRFWHMTRNPNADSLREENERKMQKYGYHADNEWYRDLLFDVRFKKKQIVWTDIAGYVVARAVSIEPGSEITVQVDLPPKMKDVLLTCWVAHSWSVDFAPWAACRE
ncbi:hypothetical protein M501DRAFT_1002768 [Patellaria atrata CBS 101060]|uniref:Uncharacterized protein n=1 Tax=Patellaria atrata CBS 101060 TaxID=1346257 RepID=A0A9P4VP30_9PEZI|nr:hypothetical protein M501DRAFT_1002768 [Patellaria atrata CBS 101060]